MMTRFGKRMTYPFIFMMLLLLLPSFAEGSLDQPIMAYGGGRAGAFAFSPDGKIYAMGRGKYLLLADAVTGKCLRILCGHQGKVFGAAFSADGTKIVTSSLDGASPNEDQPSTDSLIRKKDFTARLWSVSGGDCLKVFEGHTNSIVGMAISADGTRVVTGSDDNTAKYWNAETGQCLLTLTGHEHGVGTVALAPDGTTILTGSGDHTARLWDAKSGQCTQVLRGHEGPVFSASFSPDGKRVVTGSPDKTARVWDVNTGKELLKMDCGYSFFKPRMGKTGAEDFFGPLPPEDLVLSVAFTKDGSKILTGISSGEVIKWDASSGKRIGTIPSNVKVKDLTQKKSGLCEWVVVSPDEAKIMTGSLDGKVRIWDVRGEKCIQTFGGHGSHKIAAMAISPDGKVLATGGSDGTGCLWNIDGGQCIHSLSFDNPNGYYVNGVAFSPNSETLVTSSWDGRLRIWETETGRLAQTTPFAGKNGVRSVAWSADGEMLVVGDGNQTARINKIRGSFAPEKPQTGPDMKVAISFDHSRLLTASFSDSASWLKLWDVSSQKCMFTKALGSATIDVCFSADGQTFLSGWDNGNARLWRTSDGTCLREFDMKNTKKKRNYIDSLALSPDGKIALTGLSDGQAWLWQTADGQCIRKVNGHSEKVTCVAFTPDGKKFLTASEDGIVLLWRTMGEVVKQEKFTPLQAACEKGQVDVIKRLIEDKTDVNAATEDSDTPLHIAAAFGNAEIVKLLIAANANVSAATRDGYTPLHLAAIKGHGEVVTLLLAAKANVNAALTDGFTPLFQAALYGHPDVLKLLLDAGANVNAVVKNDNTLLHCLSKDMMKGATISDQIAVMRLLLSAKANVNAVTKDGDTPLHYASQKGHAEVVKVLLGASANVNATSKEGYTPLLIASSFGQDQAVKLLIEAKANVNAATPEGMTPLHVASIKGHGEVVKLLLAAKANVNAVEKDGHTPLFFAKQGGHDDVIKMLKKAGAN